MSKELLVELNRRHIYYCAAGENEWNPLAGWYFSDETEYLNGPYESAIIALMQLDMYALWLEGIPA